MDSVTKVNRFKEFSGWWMQNEAAI